MSKNGRINMSKNKVGDSVSTLDKKKLNRRNFIKRSAAIGVGTAAFGTASTGPTQAQAITWDYEADVVVLGAGATGLPAAIRARDLGASPFLKSDSARYESSRRSENRSDILR